ncbi:TonB-dependent receptor domain-containing protein [Phenylobacterium sp.]|uniref:TonB-dependent receptor domain-containing protein n=1 Tax=Phenylobacterium sp. TaxID=1871053 RepID=UPI002C84A8DD|nr:TonB-dependent receptor [Phenylobacterium sp.]HLZ77236.1 TonB-dependent receptor [Phenylobacterium sp.]
MRSASGPGGGVLLAVAALAVIAPCALTATPAEAQPVAYQFDIPARDLGGALRAFGERSNTQILFSQALVSGRRSPALRGRMSQDDALKILLSHSNLTFRRTSANVILVTEATDAGPSPVAEKITQRSHPTAAPEPAADPHAVIDEVLVTGEKRTENVQDVPGSVLVATPAAMERSNVRDFDDLVKIAPSVTITKTSQPGNNSINIRGIGTYAFSIATESSVAVVVDDVPQAFQAAAFSALVDVQQVEVLRGPQNTLFGKAASAGVISITTQPATDHFTAHGEAMFTDDHEQRYQATISGPLNEVLKFRLAANYSDYRGNVFNLTDGHWLNGQSDTTLRGKLVWTPDADWTVTLSPYITRTVASCCTGAELFVSPGVTVGRNNVPQPVVLAGITPGPDNQNARYDVDARGNALDYGSGLRIVRELGGLTLTSISSYDHYYLYDRQDTDSTDIDFSQFAPTAPKGGSANGGDFKINSVTQELRLTSADSGPLRYVGGLFYSRTGSARFFVRGSNDLGTFNGLASLPTTNSTAYSAYLSRAEATNYAVFGQGSYRLTDELNLLAGLRINREDIRYSFVDYADKVTYGDPRCSTASPTLPIQTCNSNTSVTGRVGGQYYVTPALMTFATYSRGEKGMAYDLSSTLTIRALLAAGPLKGVPTADAVAARQPIPPETVDSFEMGFKSTFFDRRLTWNATAFDMIFHGFQAQSRDQITNQNVLNSIGKVTSKGVETELAARLNERLSVTGSAAYTDAVMNSFPNAGCFPAQTAAQGCINAVQDLSGKPLSNAPKWNINLNAQYEAPLAWAGGGYVGFATAGYRWQSKVIFNLLQDPDSIQNAYGVANVSAGVRNDRWKLTAFVDNLFDQRYALTRGRDTQWNINQTAIPPTDAINWKPARDSFRYVGVRAAVTY